MFQNRPSTQKPKGSFPLQVCHPQHDNDLSTVRSLYLLVLKGTNVLVQKLEDARLKTELLALLSKHVEVLPSQQTIAKYMQLIDDIVNPEKQIYPRILELSRVASSIMLKAYGLVENFNSAHKTITSPSFKVYHDLEADRLSTTPAEIARLAKEKADRLAKEEADRLVAEQEEIARLAKEEADRLVAEKEEIARLAKEEADRLVAEQEEERLAAEQEEIARLAEQEAERLAAEQEEIARLAKEETDRLVAEQEADRLAKEETDRLAAEQAVEQFQATMRVKFIERCEKFKGIDSKNLVDKLRQKASFVLDDEFIYLSMESSTNVCVFDTHHHAKDVFKKDKVLNNTNIFKESALDEFAGSLIYNSTLGGSVALQKTFNFNLNQAIGWGEYLNIKKILGAGSTKKDLVATIKSSTALSKISKLAAEIAYIQSERLTYQTSYQSVKLSVKTKGLFGNKTIESNLSDFLDQNLKRAYLDMYEDKEDKVNEGLKYAEHCIDAIDSYDPASTVLGEVNMHKLDFTDFS